MKPDGGWGWVVATASFLTSVLLDGVKYSFGIMFIELVETFHGSKSKTSWVISIQIGVMLLSGCVLPYVLLGPIMASLVNKFGCRTTAVLGTIVSSGGFIASSFVNSVYALYVTFGFIAGLGFGMMIMPCRVILVKYFDKRLAFATGLANMGTGVGALAFNPLSKALIDKYTWRGTMLIEAGIILNGLACGLVLKSPRKVNDHAIYKTYDNEDTEKSTKLNQMLQHQDDNNSGHTKTYYKTETNVEQITDARVELILTNDNEQSSYRQTDDKDTNINSLDSTAKRIREAISTDSEEQVKIERKVNINTKRRWLSFSPLKNPGFIVFLIANVLIELSLNVPIAFIPDLMYQKGFEIQEAVWIIFVIGLVSTISRLVIGIIADLPVIDRVKMCNTLVIVTGALVTLCPFCFNFASFISFAVFYGIFSGSYNSLRGVLIPDLFGSEKVADHYGIAMFFSGFAVLFSLPISGALFDVTRSYLLPFILAGAELIVSGTLLFLIPTVQMHCKQNKKQNK